MSYRTHPLLEVSLPENVMIDVLLRLPVKTIVTCKCVCKRWRDLVADPYFVDLHLSRSREEALLILQCQNVQQPYAKPLTLKWVKLEEHEHLDTVKSLNLMQCKPPITDGFLLFPVGSVNGLVSYWETTNASIYILNPLLEEYMTLPLPPSLPRRLGSFMTLGYGFGVSTAGEYKVVEISKTPFEAVFVIRVHTLGTDGWRSLRQTPPNNRNLMSIKGPAGVHLNSHLYWLADDQVYDFDLSSETSELFPCPPVAPGDNQKPNRRLGVLKGRLSYICWCSSGGGVEVWVRKDESTNWCKEITVIKPVIQLRPPIHQPLCLIDGVEGTCVLFFYVQVAEAGKLVVYCLNTNMILNETPFSWSNSRSIITYRPSFFKLDNFGSEGVHAMYNHNPQGLKKT